MFSASMVSARMDPMTKAPSAEENPAFTASRTMPRQSPSDTTNKVSPLSHCFVFFRKVGIRNIPVIDQKTREGDKFKDAIDHFHTFKVFADG